MWWAWPSLAFLPCTITTPRGPKPFIRPHTVSNGLPKCAFGPYERLAPPPEVFGGSIPSHVTIEVM